MHETISTLAYRNSSGFAVPQPLHILEDERRIEFRTGSALMRAIKSFLQRPRVAAEAKIISMAEQEQLKESDRCTGC